MRTVNIPATGSGNWQLIVLDNVQVTSGQIEIGVHSQSSTGGQWLRVDDVVLAPNVAANFSFEADGKGTGTPAGWSEWSPNCAGDLNASFTEAMGTAHGGTFQLAQWRNTPYAVGTYQIVNVPNGLYTLTAWVESSGGQDQAYMYAYRYDTAAGGQIRTVNIPATGSGPGDWKMLVLNNVQVTSGQIEIGFFSKTSQGNQWIRVDDVSLIDPPEDGGAVPGGGPAPRPLTNERSAGTAAPLPIPEEVAGGPREAKADRPYQPTAAYHDIDLTEAAPLLAAPPRNEGVAEPTRKRTKPPVKKDPWADLNQAEGWELPFDKAA
jgi:hypothetical protein